MVFSWVPAGCYRMGCGDWADRCFSDEKPLHEVCLDGFWMGRTEVTHARFVRFLNAAGRSPDPREPWCQTRNEDATSHIIERSGRFSVASGFEDHPVAHVSWFGAVAFARWLSGETGHDFRLPTEAQWEYAARSGGKAERRAGGLAIDRIAWYAGNSGRSTHPVGQLAANGLGLFDMTGNVWEWCLDVYSRQAYRHHDRNNPVITGNGPDVYADRTAERVDRGGSWYERAPVCNTGTRHYFLPDYRYGTLGFRLVRIEGEGMVAGGP